MSAAFRSTLWRRWALSLGVWLALGGQLDATGAAMGSTLDEESRPIEPSASTIEAEASGVESEPATTESAGDGDREPVSFLDWEFATGDWLGLRDDVIGLGTTYGRLSDRAGFSESFELAVEAFYKIQITPYLYIQPVFHYIVNPGGDGARNALAATFRIHIDL